MKVVILGMATFIFTIPAKFTLQVPNSSAWAK